MTHRNDLIPSDATAVTPGDTTPVNFVGFYVGVSGDVAVQSAEGTTITFVAVAAGQIIPLRVVRIMSTGTTATSIVGFKA